jgi:hypothetical protein
MRCGPSRKPDSESLAKPSISSWPMVLGKVLLSCNSGTYLHPLGRTSALTIERTVPLNQAYDIHERFFLLSGLVRHEFWLHDQKPEDHGYVADPDTLTLRAIKQDDNGSECIFQLTEETLRGDLHALAAEFYKGLCQGRGRLARESGQRQGSLRR